jgi:hypothetical protein
MDYFSPVNGVEAEEKTFSKTVEFNPRSESTILSPVDGTVIDKRGESIKIEGDDGHILTFDKVGRASVTNGSRVFKKRTVVGYTKSDDALELTIFNDKNSKVDVKKYLKGEIAPITTGNDKTGSSTGSKLYKSTNVTDGKKISDYALVRGVVKDVALAPFTAFQALTKESVEESEKILKEQVERIKQLMK